VVVEREDLTPRELGRQALAVPVREQAHDDHGLLDPVRQPVRGRATLVVEQSIQTAVLVPDPPPVQARPARAECQHGGDPLGTSHPHAPGPETDRCEIWDGTLARRSATPRREEQEAGPLLVRMAE